MGHTHTWQKTGQAQQDMGDHYTIMEEYTCTGKNGCGETKIEFKTRKK